METKVCNTCEIKKPFELFTKNKHRINGRSNLCKECAAKRTAIYRSLNPEKVKQSSIKSKKKLSYRLKKIELERDNYRTGRYLHVRIKYQNSAKGKLASKKAKKKWVKNNPYKIKEKEDRQRRNLNDGYIKNKLRRKGFTTELENNDLIEVQRLLIKTKRLCKTLQNSEKV